MGIFGNKAKGERRDRPWRKWQGDQMFRRQLLDISYLLSSNFLAALLGLIAFALTARALGPPNYGVLALLNAYTRTIDRFISFQSWQPLIKFGADAHSAAKTEDFAALMKFGLLLDLSTSIAGWAIAIIGACLAWMLFAWESSHLSLVFIYATVLLFGFSGMPTAVLRLFGKFRILAIVQVVSASIQIGLCGWGLEIGGGLTFFACVWMGMQVFSSLIILIIAYWELRKRGMSNFLSSSIRDIHRKYSDLWNFTWSANLSLTLRASTNELDVLLVGILSDTSSAALYQIAKRAGRLAQLMGAQTQAVLYPDIAKLWAKGEVQAFKNAIARIEYLLVTAGIAVFVFFFFVSEPLLRWTAGPAFVSAAGLLTVQMAAVAVNLMGIALRAALLSMGAQRQVIRIAVAGTAVFFATSLVLVPKIGPMGANIGHIALGIVTLTGLIISFRRILSVKAVVASKE